MRQQVIRNGDALRPKLPRADQAVDVAATVQHAKDDHIRSVDGIDDHVRASWIATQARAQVIAGTP